MLTGVRGRTRAEPTSGMNNTDATVADGAVPGEGFLRRLDWSAFWTAAAVSFAVYFYTLAPTVTLEDSGELAVAGDYLGVPHPPGYPIWSMLSWIFSRIFRFVSFRGQPNPAWSIGLSSAFCGALATGVTAALICRSGSDLLRESHHAVGESERGSDRLICWIAGVAASLLFAFSPCMWSQAVIVEVYSLNAFFLMLIFLLVYLWMRQPSDRLFYLTAFVFGLGLTNYQALLLAALALVVAVALRDLELFRDFAILGLPYVAVLALVRRWGALPGPLPNVDSVGGILSALFTHGALPPIVHPLHATCAFYMIGNIALLALGFFFLPRGRTVAPSFLCAQIGVAFYAYMPIVSDLRNPPMNWAYPRTWEGFKHAISRGQYEKIVPTDVFSFVFVQQLGTFLTDLRRQFTLPLALLGFLPLATWQMRVGARRFQALYAAVVLAVLATVFVTVEEALGGASAFLSRVYKLLILGVLLIMGLGVVNVLLAQLDELGRKALGRMRASVSERVTAALALLGVAGAYAYYVKTLAGNIAAVTAPLRAPGANIVGPELQRIFAGSAGIAAAALAPALIVGLIAWLVYGPCRLTATIAHMPQKWVVATVFGFVAMGVVFIALANLKMDIQDTFIQRVKFISSHGLYSLWIGYGLVFGLALTDALFRGNRAVRWLCVGAAAALPLMPLAQNAFNRDLIRVYGGAEQNGHDFGWQFGNYQLRGAEAVSEELAPDEEPLPNPVFPPAMGPDAIFFGGTDPGRFVPTYMIYSARVREDVYLITQNALADNTYMSVMRDLYGDQIWIPAQPDSTRAFQRYVEEVQAGTRPRNAELKIENGRVQVSGALGVMEINGILAQMIFEHNNYKHDFYVEESYVIPWMFPFMTPHGLIMKIHPRHTPLDPRVARDDQDFWDWYTRRLHGSRAFERDVVARKSFSKLRSAIGGLYRSRGMLGEAENAFRQARTLYPLSPEANFRLAQEVLLPMGRLAETRELMAEFSDMDPDDRKAPEFLGRIDEMQNLQRRIQAIEEEMRKGDVQIARILELADLYRQAGQGPRFMHLVMGIVNNPQMPAMAHFRAAQMLRDNGNKDEMIKALDLVADRLPPETPPQALMEMARMYGEAGRIDRALQCLRRYLEKQPGDWSAWLNVAAMHMAAGRNEDAARALEQAVRTGGDAARGIIESDARFSSLYRQAAERARNLIGIPGLTPRQPGL